MRMPAHIGMDSDWEAELVVFAVEVVEVISPQILNVSRINPPMRIRRFLDEHHWWQVLQSC